MWKHVVHKPGVILPSLPPAPADCPETFPVVTIKGGAAGVGDAAKHPPHTPLPAPPPAELSGPGCQQSWGWEILICKQVGVAVFQ